MRTLIVIGSTPHLREVLDTLDNVEHVTVEPGKSAEALTTAMDRIENLSALGPDAAPIIAYGPGVFGAVMNMQPSSINTGAAPLVLCDFSTYDGDEKENPMQWVDAARAVLKPELTLNPDRPAAFAALRKLLEGDA